MKIKLFNKKFRTPWKNKIHRPKPETIILSVMFVIAFIYALTLLFPFVWVGYTSLRTNVMFDEFILNKYALPTDVIAGLQNYKNVFTMTNSNGIGFIEMLINSIEYSFVLTAVSIWFPTSVAYVMRQYRFKLRGLYMGIIIFNMTVPIVGGTASMMKLLGDLNLLNDTYLGIYLFGMGGFGGTTFIVMSFFANMEFAYAESAFMDGASHWKVFVKIYLPMAIPIMVTIGVLAFIGYWNDYTNIFLYADQKPNLAFGVIEMRSYLENEVGDFPASYAFMMLSILPGFILFLCFQKTILKNFNMGGLKG